MGDFFTGSDPSISYAQSPQQAAVFNAAFPAMQRMWNQAQGGEMAYNIPAPVLPTQDWYDSIAQPVKQGMMAPYVDMSNQLTESLGYSAGSARGGPSGTLGGAQARFWSDAGKDYGMNLWNMSRPGLMAEWQAKLNRATMPFQAAPNVIQGTYPNPVVTPGKTGLIEGALTAATNVGAAYATGGLMGGGWGWGGSPQQMYNPAYMGMYGY